MTRQQIYDTLFITVQFFLFFPKSSIWLFVSQILHDFNRFNTKMGSVLSHNIMHLSYDCVEQQTELKPITFNRINDNYRPSQGKPGRRWSAVVSISKLVPIIQQNKNEFTDERYFLMCKSCYWCASCLTNDDGYISTCPVCDTNKMEWLPISQSESYRLEYDDIRGGLKIEGDIPT